MNGIIALCHFCEMHGPSVMFLTQTFHDNEQPCDVFENGCTLPARKQKPYYGNPEYAQRTVPSTPTPTSAPTSPKISDTCEACRFKPFGFPDLVCNDHEARVSYISSQHPYHPEVFSIVRQACVRSLSCEVCPGREGPIFFGDSSRGHVISHTFFLRDSQARGFHRWYSIIVIMMDKIYLLNSWPFLVKQIKKVIDVLQKKATAVYDIEQSKCSQRAVRLNSVTETTPSNFRRQRGSTKVMRSLARLTDDNQIFPFLHHCFSWILRAGGNNISETLLEGLPTEDTVINLEKQEDTNECLQSFNNVPDDDSFTYNSKDAFVINNIRHLFQYLGEEKFKVLSYHSAIGNQVIIKSDDKTFVSSFINALKSLLPNGCFRPIYYATEYEDSWKCNFIGIPPKLKLPDHILNSDLHIVIQITFDEDVSKNAKSDPKAYICNICSSMKIPNKLPQILLKMIKGIQDALISNKVLEHFFISLKEEWMNKVKVLFKFSRSDSRSKDETDQIFIVMGALNQDKQLLKFWMTGLSTPYKTHILSATLQGTNTH